MGSDLQIDYLGLLIRKVRKDRGLTQNDLVDENISIATISNIENGLNVSDEKVHYLLTKLGIDFKDVNTLIQHEATLAESFKFHLKCLESLVEFGDPEEAIKQLDKYEMMDKQPLAPWYYSIKGRYYKRKRDWKKAEREFLKAIRRAEQFPTNDNIQSICYDSIACSCYYQNDLEQALHYLRKGLEAFNENGDRKQIKYILLTNKIYYLIRLDRFERAYDLVEELWNSVSDIVDKTTLLFVYVLRAMLLRKKGRLIEAIECVEKGIDIARLNRDVGRSFDLWCVLGSIYLKQLDYIRAEHSLHMALSIDPHQKMRHKHVEVYTYLGILSIYQDDYDSGISHLTKAIEIGKETDNRDDLSIAFMVMGNLYRKLTNYPKAVEYYKEVVNICQNIPYLEKRNFLALYGITNCLLHYDKDEFCKQAELVMRLQEELHLNIQEEEYEIS